MVVFVLANGLGSARLGISAGRRLGPAPVRNRIKRRLREIFRNNAALRGLGADIVVNVREAAALASFSELERELLRCSDRIYRSAARRAPPSSGE